jgi:hypothetical protein
VAWHLDRELPVQAQTLIDATRAFCDEVRGARDAALRASRRSPAEAVGNETLRAASVLA